MVIHLISAGKQFHSLGVHWVISECHSRERGTGDTSKPGCSSDKGTIAGCRTGWWDVSDDTVLQTQDSNFHTWWFEAEYSTSWSQRLFTILNIYESSEGTFCFFETESRDSGAVVKPASLKSRISRVRTPLWSSNLKETKNSLKPEYQWRKEQTDNLWCDNYCPPSFRQTCI